MNLFDNLMAKAKEAKLAHFYIVESPLSEENSFQALVEFTHRFIQEYYLKVEGQKQPMTTLIDHPDVFVLGNLPTDEERDSDNFTVVESETLNRFFEFKSVQSKRKFAVITEGHRITNMVANKWLKLLEEPQGNATIFILNPRRQKFLDTIHSRALHLRLPATQETHHPEEFQSFMAQTSQQSLSQFLEANNKSDKDVEYWTGEMLIWEALQFDQPTKKDAVHMWLKKLQEMETFHQPSATKWALYYSYLHHHILPRATH